jgi:16S rRNA (uracil1498-N3)-methyltransferase
MHRCFAHPADWFDSRVRLASEERHHLVDVLRAKAGDRVLVFDGQGREAGATLSEVHPDHAILGDLCGERRVARGVAPLLIQALPKGAGMDAIVEKATELGVGAIAPVVAERVIGRLSEARQREREDRWRRVAVSAAKQCGACWLPQIYPIRGLEEALAALRGGLDLLLTGALTGRAQSLRDALRSAPSGARRFGLLIGPEGDLTERELRLAAEAGGVPVSFGPRVLRVETAALFGLSALAYEFSAAEAAG